MTAVAAAAAQPGVSVVSMSWGFAEGQTVLAADEARYDSTFDVPGVTFVAGTGDYGAADPEYPAFSPNVVAVGGTTLSLNGDDSYNSETGWGYNSGSTGVFIGSGGGISMYEPEPVYQSGVQSTGFRTTPDVSLVADPATGAWIADTYNLGADNPFEVVGGTSLSAPAWSGLMALVNEGRAAAGEATLDSSSSTETQQALYDLPQSDYNVITSGSNGYTASAGYNLVTGLGTPVANLLVGDLIAYHGPGTTYSGPTVGALQNAALVSTGTDGGSTSDVFSVFSAITMSSSGLAYGQGAGGAAGTTSAQISGATDRGMASSALVATQATTLGTTVGLAPGFVSRSGPSQTFGWAATSNPNDQTSEAPAVVTVAPVRVDLGTYQTGWSRAQAAVNSRVYRANPDGSHATTWEIFDDLIASRSRKGFVSEPVLHALAADAILWPSQPRNGTIAIPVMPTDRVAGHAVVGDTPASRDLSLTRADYAAGLAVLGLATGLWARRTGPVHARKRQFGCLLSSRTSN